VFIDADDDVRILRRVVRDVRERGRTPESILEQYLSTVRPMHKQFVEACKHHADIIVPGLATSAVAIDLLVTRIKAHLGSVRP
jgi:uridine kinase